jgi:hypothetical protein
MSDFLSSSLGQNALRSQGPNALEWPNEDLLNEMAQRAALATQVLLKAHGDLRDLQSMLQLSVKKSNAAAHVCDTIAKALNILTPMVPAEPVEPGNRPSYGV